MAKYVSQITFGIDVGKDELVIADWNSGHIFTLANDPKHIRAWLASLIGPVRMALEPTSYYHMNMADLAEEAGVTVYLVNARQVAHYREAVAIRHKSDPVDAELLARYLAHEGGSLKPYQPRSPAAREIWALLHRRATLTQMRKQAKQSFQGVGMSIQGLITAMDAVLKRIDRRLDCLIEELGWVADYDRCRSIPGIGHLNAIAMVTVFHRAAFSSSDAFVAYLGMDVRMRESGRFKGKRRLTKKGPAEVRRLLYCAVTAARSYDPFDRYRQRQLDKGLPKTAANCILGRKLARIAYALMVKEEMFMKTAK